MIERLSTDVKTLLAGRYNRSERRLPILKDLVREAMDVMVEEGVYPTERARSLKNPLRGWSIDFIGGIGEAAYILELEIVTPKHPKGAVMAVTWPYGNLYKVAKDEWKLPLTVSGYPLSDEDWLKYGEQAYVEIAEAVNKGLEAREQTSTGA